MKNKQVHKNGFYHVAGILPDPFPTKPRVVTEYFYFKGDYFPEVRNLAWEKYKSLVRDGYDSTITLYKSYVEVLEESKNCK